MCGQLRLFAQEPGIPTTEENKAQERRDKDFGGEPPAVGGGQENKKPRGRQPLTPHLKRERIVHDLDEAEKCCTSCNQQLRHIGEEVSERYEYLPAQTIVIEDACQKDACVCMVRTATKPGQPIDKSTA
jgi:transposase